MTNELIITPFLNQLLDGQSLSFQESCQIFQALLSGGLTPAQIAGFVVALRCKGEAVDEVAGAASVMRELVTPVQVNDSQGVVDLCGTGGDGAKTFNISTACMFVLAACGVVVGKHGGRSVSSSSGSADVLEVLGVNINLSPSQVAQCMEETGLGFMFAPNHHSAMRFAAPVRKQLGVRTVFNLLGPLTNPAGAKRQLMGVYHKNVLSLQAEVLGRLGSTHALVVHGANGMDELCIDGETHVAELRDGQVTQYAVTPEQFGIKRQPHDALGAGSVQESLTKLKMAIEGQGGPVADIVALNSGAALYVAGRASSIEAGVSQARDAMNNGQATAKLNQFVELTQRLGRTENE